jgi:hypothetical protein
MPTLKNEVNGNDEPAIVGGSPKGRGVVGQSETNYGVSGDSQISAGIRGTSVDGRGIEGWTTKSEGVMGISKEGIGVWGQTEGTGAGVAGTSKEGPGVVGRSKTGRAVEGWSESNYGVTGDSETFAGVRGTSVKSRGVEGWSKDSAGLFGISERDVGVHAKGAKLAGLFEGDVEVTGDIRLANADCAEDFDVMDDAQTEPGTVLVLGSEGKLLPCCKPYDKCVAGVVSGAGDYKPGIVLDKQKSSLPRKPVALLGKVFCKVDAHYGAIEIGDLLTTSATLGHAMLVTDPHLALGTIIGKAMQPLHEGQGLIPILIALQ